MFSEKNPNGKMSLISELNTNYGGAGTRDLIFWALKDPKTAEMASKLLAEKSSNTGSITGIDPMYDILGDMIAEASKNLSTANMAKRVEEELVRSIDVLNNPPRLSIWIKYMEALNKEHPGTMVDTLRKQFGDTLTAQLLIRAQRTSKDMADDLQTSLLNKWEADKIKPSTVAVSGRITGRILKSLLAR
ncbi:hypothetical protein GN244_ATG19422 [Phytophthora infestans]|uniref:Uncharacterized protein n=1 Tax=Phytophthora infestans TaxID=4787 RepID=A0A833SJB1_PHYIN|nr:hypothetical protein GN244_ATG19422 [Phytophthora infestans]